MAEVGSAYLSIVPQAPGFERLLARETGGAFDKAGREGGRRMGQGVEKGSKQSFAAAGAKVGGAFAAAFAALGVTQILGAAASAVKDFAMDSIRAASDLGESVNAVNVTFGDAADGILELSEKAATAVGLSKSQFNGLAVQFSNFAQTVAGEGGDVVKVMDDLTTRGADFASVMNMDVAEAMTLFQSGLAGETEPLRRYGIDLSAAAVETYALANGIATAGTEMTEQEKVQARYGLLMQQTTKTTGDFANTSDSLANRQRVLAAEFENVKSEIGEALLPIMNDLMGFVLEHGIPALQSFAAWVKDNEDGIKAFAVAIADMTLAAVEGFLRMVAAGAGWYSATAGVIANVWRIFSDFVQNMLDGAAKAFSWVPGVGPKLQSAADEFRSMDTVATRSLALMEQSARSFSNGVSNAADSVAGLRNQITMLKDKDVYVRVHTTQLSSGRTRVESTKFRAHGGPVEAGQPYIVGEYEPELFVPDRPGTILNQQQIAAAGIGGDTWNVYADPKSAAELVEAGMTARRHQAAVRGRLV